jgi:hypothetical protein
MFLTEFVKRFLTEYVKRYPEYERVILLKCLGTKLIATDDKKLARMYAHALKILIAFQPEPACICST